MIHLQVDGSSGAGNTQFLDREEKKSKTFENKGLIVLQNGESDNFNGQVIENKCNIVEAHQHPYIYRAPS